MSNNPEKISFGPEHDKGAKALEEVGNRQREILRNNREAVSEQAPEKNIESARHEVEQATKIEHEAQPQETERAPSPAERRKNGPIGATRQEASFKATMKEVQTQMSAPSRAFSKVIHNKTIEKASDVAAGTIARPNAILSGAIFAFILTLAVYLIAKNLGYPLSGFETIGAFALGWILGLTYDFLKVMVTGRK